MLEMFKNMKVGARIGIGFATLIIIAVFLGILAVWNMNKAQGRSVRLAQEYVPEVAVSNNVERYSLLTMYNIRGYALSRDKDLLKEGRKYLEDVKKYLLETKEMADKNANLVEGVKTALEKVSEYERLVNETEEKNEAMVLVQEISENTEVKYRQNCFDFLKSQNETMEKEILAGAEPSELQERLKKNILVNDLIDLGNFARAAIFKAQVLHNPEILQDALTNFSTIETKLEELRPITRKQVNLKQIEEIREAAQQYEKGMKSLINNWLSIEEINAKREKTAFKVLEIAKEVSLTGMNDIIQATEESQAALSDASRVMTVGLVIAVIIGIILAVYISRTITKPVIKLVDFAKQSGEGNLTAKIDMESKDEIGILARAFNSMIGSLREIVKQLADGTSRLSSSSEEISSTTEEMSRGAESQMDQVVRTSSAMDEMAATIEEVSRSARSTSDTATAASNLAREGSEKVKNTVEGITNANESIKKLSVRAGEIGKVVQLIGDIAAQTNILALNAAIEAARAGEHGRGFDVVAEEIRKLAQKTTQSTGEISAIVEEIQRETQESARIMDEGATMANEAGQALDDIVEGIVSTTDMVQMITTSAEQQAKTSAEIANSLQSISAVSKQSAVGAKESARTTQDLTALALQLKEITEKFKV